MSLKLLSAGRLFAVAIALLAVPSAFAEEAGTDDAWPREYKTPMGTVSVYHPQVDDFEADKLKFRAAISVREEGKEPIFGAAWLSCRLVTDRENRMARLEKIAIDRVKMSDGAQALEKPVADELARAAKDKSMTITLEELTSLLAAAEKEFKAASDLKAEAPKFFHSRVPAVLLTFDGEPKATEVEGTKVKRVLNTAFFVVQDEKGAFWLRGGDDWWTATAALGPWTKSAGPGDEVKKLATQSAIEAPKDGPKPENAEQILVSTGPAELVVTEGEARMATIAGTNLLYVENTSSRVFHDLEGGDLYILVAGRWFSAPGKDGPWESVAADKLPADFAKIPPGCDVADVRTFVAGTEEAEEALADAQVPQTAKVKKGTAGPTVTYDGEPQFKPIEGIGIEVAVNTPFSVLKIKGRFYLCHEGIWYESDSANGPWALCLKVPAEVQQIPPSESVYNVKYVYVYDDDPDYVYVGYTPGYYWCFAWHATICWGTGWHYHGWHGHHHYYPRPTTYGFHARYNPHTGNWAFGVGVKGPHGWVGVGAGSIGGVDWVAGGAGGWWGSAGFIDVDSDWNRGDFGHADHHSQARTNAYERTKRPGVEPGTAPRPTPAAGGATPSTRDRATQENVFADKNGDVYRKSMEGWEKRDGGSWKPEDKPAKSTAKPADKPAKSSQPSRQLDREYKARDRGTQRATGSGSGGGARGGGGRGR